MRSHAACNRGIQNCCLALALRGSLPVTNQLRKLLTPKKKTNSLVEQAVFSVSQSLAGEQNPVPGKLFHSSSLPIDCKVSDKVQAKIWANEFIDFGVLLSNPIFENKFKIAIQTVDSSGAPSLCLESASKPRKIFTIDQWGSCF